MRPAEYFTTKQAERYYPISGSYLAKLRLTGDGPEYIKIGRRVFYSRSAFEAWLRQNRRRSTSECDDSIDDDDIDELDDLPSEDELDGDDYRLTAGERLELERAARGIASPSSPERQGRKPLVGTP